MRITLNTLRLTLFLSLPVAHSSVQAQTTLKFLDSGNPGVYTIAGKLVSEVRTTQKTVVKTYLDCDDANKSCKFTEITLDAAGAPVAVIVTTAPLAQLDPPNAENNGSRVQAESNPLFGGKANVLSLYCDGDKNCLTVDDIDMFDGKSRGTTRQSYVSYVFATAAAAQALLKELFSKR